MKLSRRELIISAAATVACGGNSTKRTGTFGGLGLSGEGHRVLEAGNLSSASETSEKVDVLIVGAGISGLCAAWRLKQSGFKGTVKIVEISSVPGGTSSSSRGPYGAYPLGAHYITLPNKEAGYMVKLLTDLGIVTGTDTEGKPRFISNSICLAPQERVFVGDRWEPGLWPSWGALPEDSRQQSAFMAQCDEFRVAVGLDGKYAFSIPVSESSVDPVFRKLADIPFSDWLDSQGYTSQRLRWWIEYGCRDDYGGLLTGTSAWAGLHYHCARRPYASDTRDLGTRVMTWPAGNGHLVDQLRRKIPYEFQFNSVVRHIDNQTGDAWIESAGELRRTRAKRVILATPSVVSTRICGRKGIQEHPQGSPWVVANIHCERFPASRGARYAWDNVIYGASSLGYVVNTHQNAMYGGPSTLSWFKPFDSDDLGKARQEAVALDWWSVEAEVMDELSAVHDDFAAVARHIDVHVWGHGTVRPVPKLHAVDKLSALSRPYGLVSFAHTDLSGLSLFEEAAWHGVRAAEETLSALGLNSESIL